VTDCGVRERVTFSGALPHVDALRRMAISHVMVVPSRADAAPGVVVESLGLGVPLIITAASGLLEQLGGATCALVVPVDNPAALAEALRTVLGNPGLAAQMSAGGRELFLSRFLLDHWIADISRWLTAADAPPTAATSSTVT